MKGVAALALVAGCTSVFGLDSPQRAPRDGAVAIDSVIRNPPDAPLGPWTNVQQVFVSGEEDDDPSATGDRLELYFNRNGGIFRAMRPSIDDAWRTPALVTELSSGVDDARPQVSADGLTMMFSSLRATSSGIDIWSSQRMTRSALWAAPVRLDKINSPASEMAGSMTTDRLEIVYAADLMTTGDLDLYHSVRSGAAPEFDRGSLLSLNTMNTETSPFLTGDGQTLFFTIRIAPASADIYVSQRLASANWSDPVLISELSTQVPESDPWVSPDGRHMIFARQGLFGKFQIFEASR